MAPSEFVYDTAFPEPGLSQTIREIQSRMESDKDIIGIDSDKGLAATLHEVTIVAKIMYHFGVDEDDIPARMADMGMGDFYERMRTAGVCEDLFIRISRRDPNETRPFSFNFRYDRK
ncbi:hypothetical protein DFH06DRAFT_1309461 [Mycena polygramma]|nr:hypothetical protein DFH06DRAFT_1309461 [Mycena polygramma]